MKKALIFHLHSQPELKPFSYFDISKNRDFSSLEVHSDKAEPNIGNELLLLVKLLEEDESRSVTLALSNPLLTFVENNTALLSSLEELYKKNQVELIACPGYNSFSILFSSSLYDYEVKKNAEKLKRLFNVIPDGFLNSVLMFSDLMASRIASLGFTYCLAPRVSWFVDNGKEVTFKSKTEGLNLILPHSDDSLAEVGPVEVALANKITEDQFNDKDQYLKLANLLSAKNQPIYKLPDLVAIDYNGRGIDSLVGNNLQRDILKRLIEVSALISSSTDQDIVERVLWIGSIDHFRALSRNDHDATRYSTYITLLNLLYEVEINLR